MLCALESFVSIRPRFEMAQVELLSWTSLLHAESTAHNTKDKLLALGSGPDKIQKRGFQIPDPFAQRGAEREIYTPPSGLGMKERMQFFDRETLRFFEAFYPEMSLLPAHLIHVTCTGYVAPSPAQQIVSLRLAKETLVTHAYHMGCYAAIPAIRIAAGALALAPSPTSVVDIVHTEMCSLHLNPMDHSTEQLVVQSLFADGFIKYSATRKMRAPCLQVLALHEEILPESLDQMTWRCEEICHAMTLSKKIPLLLSNALEGFFSRLVQKTDLDEEKIKTTGYFAIHPGGPKIIEYIVQKFHLKRAQVSHSHGVMQEYGNMSSATLPHIWEKMLQDTHLEEGAFIVSFAFGPGLTLAGALFQKGET